MDDVVRLVLTHEPMVMLLRLLWFAAIAFAMWLAWANWRRHSRHRGWAIAFASLGALGLGGMEPALYAFRQQGLSVWHVSVAAPLVLVLLGAMLLTMAGFATFRR